MLEQLDQLGQEALAALETIADSKALDSWHSQYLGRKGTVIGMLRRVGELPRGERPAFGKRANEVKNELEAAYQQTIGVVKTAEMEKAFVEGAIDVARITSIKPNPET